MLGRKLVGTAEINSIDLEVATRLKQAALNPIVIDSKLARAQRDEKELLVDEASLVGTVGPVALVRVPGPHLGVRDHHQGSNLAGVILVQEIDATRAVGRGPGVLVALKETKLVKAGRVDVREVIRNEAVASGVSVFGRRRSGMNRGGVASIGSRSGFEESDLFGDALFGRFQTVERRIDRKHNERKTRGDEAYPSRKTRVRVRVKLVGWQGGQGERKIYSI